MKTVKIFLFSIVFLVVGTNADAQNLTEKFNKFWKSYAANPSFQKERTKFPLSYSYYEESYSEYEDPSLVTEYIPAGEWNYIDFNDTSEYNVEIQQKNSTKYEVFLSGNENGIAIEFLFELYEGKWYLSKVTDYSN